MSTVARHRRTFDAKRVSLDPLLRDGGENGKKLSGSVIKYDGNVYLLSQFPKRIQNIQEAGDGLVVEFVGGARKILEPAHDSLREAALEEYDLSVCELTEEQLEEAFLEGFDDDETLTEAGTSGIHPSKMKVGKTYGVNVHHGGVNRLANAKVKAQHAGHVVMSVEGERPIRVPHEHVKVFGEIHDFGEAGGASEAEYRAKAASYAGHRGGIGSSERQDIGHGKGRNYPPGFQHIRNALIRAGHSVADASRIAYGALRRWAEGRGNVKKTTRDKARKVLGELEAGKGHTREAAMSSASGRLKAALRKRDTAQYQPLVETWLEAVGDEKPVREDPSSLRDAAERIVTSKGPLRPRSDVDRRVLEAQQERVREAQEAAMTVVESTESATRVLTESASIMPEESEAPERGSTVFLRLPPARVLIEGEASLLEAPAALRNVVDVEDLREEAHLLYRKTAGWTRAGSGYIDSAGRGELAQVVHTLREALKGPGSDFGTSDEGLEEADDDLAEAAVEEDLEEAKRKKTRRSRVNHGAKIGTTVHHPRHGRGQICGVRKTEKDGEEGHRYRVHWEDSGRETEHAPAELFRSKPMRESHDADARWRPEWGISTAQGRIPRAPRRRVADYHRERIRHHQTEMEKAHHSGDQAKKRYHAERLEFHRRGLGRATGRRYPGLGGGEPAVEATALEAARTVLSESVGEIPVSRKDHREHHHRLARSHRRRAEHLKALGLHEEAGHHEKRAREHMEAAERFRETAQSPRVVRPGWLATDPRVLDPMAGREPVRPLGPMENWGQDYDLREAEPGRPIGRIKHPGAFHRWLRKKPGEPITDADIRKGLASSDPHVRRMANFARNARKWHHAKAREAGGGEDLWMQGPTGHGIVKHPGAFRAWLHKKPGEPVTDADIEKGLRSSDPHVRRMAALARTFKHASHSRHREADLLEATYVHWTRGGRRLFKAHETPEDARDHAEVLHVLGFGDVHISPRIEPGAQAQVRIPRAPRRRVGRHRPHRRNPRYVEAGAPVGAALDAALGRGPEYGPVSHHLARADHHRGIARRLRRLGRSDEAMEHEAVARHHEHAAQRLQPSNSPTYP